MPPSIPCTPPPPAERTAAYGALSAEAARTAIVPPPAEGWVPPVGFAERHRKATLAPTDAAALGMPAPPAPALALESTHVGAPPPRVISFGDGRDTSPAVIPPAATYRPPPPQGESRLLLALSVGVFLLGLAAAAGVVAWVLARHLLQ